MNLPKHRYLVHPAEPSTAGKLMERLESEGFDILSASSHVFMVQGPSGVIPVLNMLITARIAYAAPETPVEVELRQAIEAQKNSRIISVGRG